VRQGLLPRRLALALVRIGRRFPRAVLLAALGAWLVAGLAATRLDVETDILSLVPAENPAVRDFTTTIERFGSVDTLLAVVRLEQGRDLEPALAFTDRLARSLREWRLIDRELQRRLPSQRSPRWSVSARWCCRTSPD
jgi:predicted RND superfamily exporter protein